MIKPDLASLGMKSPFTQITINPVGVPPGGLKNAVSGSLGQLVVWFFNNKSPDDAVVKLDNWVTDKATNPTPYNSPVVSWFPPADPVSGELSVPAKSMAPLIGQVLVSTTTPLVLSADLTVTIKGKSYTYDPDLEVSPPGTIVFDYTRTLVEFINSVLKGSNEKSRPAGKSKRARNRRS